MRGGGAEEGAAGAGRPGCPTALFLVFWGAGPEVRPAEDPDSESTPKSAEAEWVPEGETG